MGYRYGGAKRWIADLLSRLTPKTLLLLLAVGALYLIYTTAGTVTGYLIGAHGIETTLNETQAALSRARDAQERCETSLQKTEQTFHLCAAERDDAEQEAARCTAQSSSRETELSACEQTAHALSKDLQALQHGYLTLAVNAAQRVCCRPGIEISEWNVVDGNITCVGPNRINCTSGENVTF